MGAVTARVHHGRLVVDTPSDLPEGAVVELVSVNGWDDLDDDDRVDLHQALRASRQEFEAGDVLNLGDLISELRGRTRDA